MSSGELSFWMTRLMPNLSPLQRSAVITAVVGGAGILVYRQYTSNSHQLSSLADAINTTTTPSTSLQSGSNNSSSGSSSSSDGKKKSAAVDRVFLRRLRRIIGIILPSIRSREMLHLVMLTALLFGRTILSIKIADITGDNVQFIVERDWKSTLLGIWRFALVGVPASLVNSALQYETDVLSLYFRRRYVVVKLTPSTNQPTNHNNHDQLGFLSDFSL
jgi:hypothetical protein